MVYRVLLLATVVGVCVSAGAPSPRPYFKDYTRKLLDERVERINQLHLSISKERALTYLNALDQQQVQGVGTSSVKADIAVKDALVKFYEYTGGEYWYSSDGWNIGSDDFCQWYGIKCNSTTKELVSLELRANNLTSFNGEPTAMLTNITSLEHLDLSHNYRLGETITAELLAMSKLEYIDLSYCSLGGVLPTEISGESLATVILSGNKLNGLLPTSWNSKKLRHIVLDSNAFTGPISSSFSHNLLLANLDTLVLSRNSLDGSFFDIDYQPYALRVLWLYGNQGLGGPIPSSWKYFTLLEDIELEHAKGAIPSVAIAKWANITHLQMTNGELIGQVPSDVLCNSTLRKLKYLSFSTNSLNGQLVTDAIQPCCGTPSDLVTLDLSSNFLEGPLPTCLVTGYVREVYLHNNYFTGSFPYYAADIDISRMKNLEVLQLCENTLTGGFPTYFANADTSGLRQLGLCYNQLNSFTTDMTDFFAGLKEFQTGCLLDHNPINCPVPDYIPSYCGAICSSCNSGDQRYSCDDCAGKYGCGWCDETNNCLEGSATGPMDVYRCNEWVYGNPAKCY